MRLPVVLLFVGFTVMAHADEQTGKVPVQDGFQKLDMQGFDKAMATTATGSKPKVSIGCADSTGKSYSATDVGYQDCLVRTQSKTAGSNDTSNVNLKFGN
ncbi:hypothetical protein ACLVWU_01095 [Bdellovibrio sp. HCB290]|uniref:hypothetical protein n=1 Tax=Bdellovibrio sp. HCB290 TaxID=3394356 RepID=UPI0039B59D52